MSRTFSQLFTHIVFSTKGRARLIVPDLKSELYAYLGGLTRELKGKALAVNGIADHVHLLASLPPTVSISDALRFLKANSCTELNMTSAIFGINAHAARYAGSPFLLNLLPIASAMGYMYDRQLRWLVA